MKLCRACLSGDIDLFPSDENFIYNYNLLTNLNVKAFDGKPQHFCQPCIDAVNFFIDFRNKCTVAESNLQESCTEQMIKSEKKEDDSEFIVKGEIKCEFDSLIQFEDDDQESNDDAFDIQIEEDLKLKKPRKKIKKDKSCKTKKTISPKVAPKVTEDIYKKLTTNKPACGLCGQIFDDAPSFNEHLEGHKSDKLCKLCKYQSFEHWPRLLAHRLLHTDKSQYCHMCNNNKKFKFNHTLEYHYRKVHCEEKDIRISCDQCPKTFGTAKRLTIHIWSNHSGNKFICDICSKVCRSKGALKSHIICHGDIKRFVCHLCGYSSKYVGGLAAHTIRRHTSDANKITCKRCLRVFDPVKYQKHVCSDQSKICPICGKRFRRAFARHLAGHGEEKRFKCSRCPAAYKSRSALKVHVDKHDNNPTHRCEFCERRFYSPSVLIKHRRVHTGEKPYACTKCDMRFTGNNNLKVHMKVHGEMLIVKKESCTD